MREAMKYAVLSVNKNKTLYGYTLAIKCLVRMMKLIHDVMFYSDFWTEFLSWLGFVPLTHHMQQVNTFRQPVVSYSAVFSNFYSRTMIRTVPSNFYRVHALLDLVERLEWNYLAVISSYGHDGEHDDKNFISRLSSIGVCLGEQIDLARQSSLDSSSFNSALTAIQKDQRIRAVILFTINDDLRRILMVLKQKNLEHFYRIIWVFRCTNYMEVVKDVEDVAWNHQS